MRCVFIDTSKAGECRFGIIGDRTSTVQNVRARSGSLLPLLAKHVGRKNLAASDGVCVVAGPGSFSSVRGGVLVANVLARLIRKPLVGVSAEDARDLGVLAVRLARGEFATVPYVAPIYDAEPNITRP